ncbi:hypothetical protein HJC23_002976 [Cyclotella cryptica]|uniref:GPI-GlcNAc transferase complex PIG-H component conserved domain-containing protein n=1 Tax=Cyclotella cryptica TaxID=29204 RepID=A0ABD3NLE9_9STRA|eukprot:CCRYP_020515-RA/>CCRYP_020515-RA protein AED:0.18 eAED:0.18 QI:0/-1/0/1/-1/1/1/0/261
MDRIVLRAPQNETNAIHRPFLPIALSITVALTSTLLSSPNESLNSSLDGSRSASAQKDDVVVWRDAMLNFTIASCVIFLLIQLWNIPRAFLGFRGPRRFKEAAVEITPLGVQLVTVYGVDRNDSVGQSSCDDKDEHRVRTFLPMQQIIDVIVMEVVWPHCVWSQLAFRVIKGNPMDNVIFNIEHDGNRKTDSVSASDSSKSTQQSQERDRPCRFHNIHTLLEQDRIAIVPCFPDECRGLLTYAQCLSIQMEIEKLLHIYSG